LIGSFHDDILYTVQDIRMTNIRSFCIPANENFRNKKGDSLWNRLIYSTKHKVLFAKIDQLIKLYRTRLNADWSW
jgi:hypothetical protein